MSFWSRLFGRVPSGEAAPAKPAAEVEHDGFMIAAEPYKTDGGQFQTAGTIRKTVDGIAKAHRFVRADKFGSLDAAAEFAIQKGKQIIDQQGDRLFG